MNEAFASYAHADDTATYGRIGKVVADIANSYRCLGGAELQCFFDTNAIRIGEAWRKRIEQGLASATVLLAFVSPTFLRSRFCRGEFNSFMAMGRRKHLVPLIFAEKRRIEQRYAKDAIWRTVQELQYLEIHQLRWAEPGSTVWLQNVETIASAIEEILHPIGRKR